MDNSLEEDEEKVRMRMQIDSYRKINGDLTGKVQDYKIRLGHVENENNELKKELLAEKEMSNKLKSVLEKFYFLGYQFTNQYTDLMEDFHANAPEIQLSFSDPAGKKEIYMGNRPEKPPRIYERIGGEMLNTIQEGSTVVDESILRDAATMQTSTPFVRPVRTATSATVSQEAANSPMRQLHENELLPPPEVSPIAPAGSSSLLQRLSLSQHKSMTRYTNEMEFSTMHEESQDIKEKSDNKHLMPRRACDLPNLSDSDEEEDEKTVKQQSIKSDKNVPTILPKRTKDLHKFSSSDSEEEEIEGNSGRESQASTNDFGESLNEEPSIVASKSTIKQLDGFNEYNEESNESREFNGFGAVSSSQMLGDRSELAHVPEIDAADGDCSQVSQTNEDGEDAKNSQLYDTESEFAEISQDKLADGDVQKKFQSEYLDEPEELSNVDENSDLEKAFEIFISDPRYRNISEIERERLKQRFYKVRPTSSYNESSLSDEASSSYDKHIDPDFEPENFDEITPKTPQKSLAQDKEDKQISDISRPHLNSKEPVTPAEEEKKKKKTKEIQRIKLSDSNQKLNNDPPNEKRDENDKKKKTSQSTAKTVDEEENQQLKKAKGKVKKTPDEKENAKNMKRVASESETDDEGATRSKRPKTRTVSYKEPPMNTKLRRPY